MRAVKGAIPAWSIARITRFLVASPWTARYDTKRVAGAELPRDLLFRRGDEENLHAGPARLVIVRRLEKQAGGMLVEIDGVPWKLEACTKKGYACLEPAGTMAFSEAE